MRGTFRLAAGAKARGAGMLSYGCCDPHGAVLPDPRRRIRPIVRPFQPATALVLLARALWVMGDTVEREDQVSGREPRHSFYDPYDLSKFVGSYRDSHQDAEHSDWVRPWTLPRHTSETD